MDRLARFNGIYRLFVATFVSAAAALVLDHLQKLIKDRALQWAALLVIVAIVLFIVDQVFEGLLEKSVTMRRLVAGSEFIEGFWFDISIDRKNRTVHHGSLLTISFENGALIVNGIEFDLNGARLSTFHSTSTAYSDRVLTFAYESHGESFKRAIKVGIDQLQFDNPPQSYSGFYVDFTEAVDFRVQGTRVDARTLEQNNRFRDLPSKQRFIMEQIAETTRTLNASAHP
jgi:hypothetical protein